MEIISGNPNVNKTQTDLRMREDAERLDEKWCSRQIKSYVEGEMKDEHAVTEEQTQCAYVFRLGVYACTSLTSYLPGHVCMFLCILTMTEMTPGQGVL